MDKSRDFVIKTLGQHELSGGKGCGALDGPVDIYFLWNPIIRTNRRCVSSEVYMCIYLSELSGYKIVNNIVLNRVLLILGPMRIIYGLWRRIILNIGGKKMKNWRSKVGNNAPL